MKSSFFLAVAIYLFSVAAAVNISIYSDDKCTTLITSGLPFSNPFVIDLNTCKEYAGAWLKVETCCPNAPARHSTYTDSNCTTVKTSGPGSVVAALTNVGTCIFNNMATCDRPCPTIPTSPVSSASSTGTALFAAVSAVIVACV
jgi:hypothetical protein